MTVAQILLFALGSTGLTHIVVDSSLFAPVRDWLREKYPTVHKVVSCYQCCGTWAGFVVGAAVLGCHPVTVLVCGFAGSFLAQWGALYLARLEGGS